MKQDWRRTDADKLKLIITAAAIGVLCLLSWRLLLVIACFWLLYRLWF